MQPTNTPVRATFHVMQRALESLLYDMRILSGETMGPSNSTWQDVAGTASTNAQVLANQLMQARLGNHEPFITFPSPTEILEQAD